MTRTRCWQTGPESANHANEKGQGARHTEVSLKSAKRNRAALLDRPAELAAPSGGPVDLGVVDIQRPRARLASEHQLGLAGSTKLDSRDRPRRGIGPVDVGCIGGEVDRLIEPAFSEGFQR